MPGLSDNIEQFIKELMEQCGEVSLQRNELAQHFSCAPSQINYVLSTRFTLDHGYIIDSKRGGGGYIRVLRVECGDDNLVQEMACNRIGDALTKADAYAMVAHLLDRELITLRESELMKAALSACTMPAQSMQDGLYARMMRAMLRVFMLEQLE